jgi:hypothetical protein
MTLTNPVRGFVSDAVFLSTINYLVVGYLYVRIIS